LLVSSHILAELDEYSTHMLVLRGGRVVENRDLRASAQPLQRIHIRLAAPHPGLGELLRAYSGIRTIEADDRAALVELAAGAGLASDLLAHLVNSRLPVCGFTDVREDLQASYLRTVGGT
ncbi:MAG TPA: hypothetical protein VES36_09735, partial [Candidatus Limnocylindrales bacterium]|nr:hypothetical protein [Candidatus Limnocylindrales bacterium]